MRAKEHLREMTTRMRTAVRLYHARRRTRQIFRHRRRIPVIIAVILAVMIGAAAYFLSAAPAPPEEPVALVDESDTADNEMLSAAPVTAVTEAMSADAAQADDTQKADPSMAYPIDTSIPDNITRDVLFGDERFDATLPDVCFIPLKDMKQDVENVYEYNFKAKEEFERAEQEYLHQKEKVEDAHARLVEERQKLDAIRIGCIEEQQPFGEASEAYLESVTE